jgi:hypothetical protein
VSSSSRRRCEARTRRCFPATTSTSAAVVIDGSLSDETIHDMIEDSYNLVVSALPRARRRALGWTGDL